MAIYLGGVLSTFYNADTCIILLLVIFAVEVGTATFLAYFLVGT